MSVVNYRCYLLYVGRQRRGGGHARHGTDEGRASECSPLVFIFFCAAPKVDVPPLLPMAVLSRESMMVDEGLAGTDVQHDHLVAVAGRSAASLPYEHHVERLHASVCFASL